MVGQLGVSSISSISFSGKYLAISNFTLFAISSTASILMAQFIGQKNKENVKKAFALNFTFSLILGLIFTLIGILFTKVIMTFYTNDESVISEGVKYLKIASLTGILTSFISMFSSYLHNNKKAYFTTISSMVAVILNALLNYLLIFGNYNFPKLGVVGASYATVISQVVNLTLITIFFIITNIKSEYKISFRLNNISRDFFNNTIIILTPLFLTELMWSLGQNVFGSIYGHTSTEASAAMANISPVVGLTIGFFSGVSNACGIMCGNILGTKDESLSMKYAKRFILISIIGSIIIGIIVSIFAKTYANIFNVSDTCKQMTVYILYVDGAYLWSKVTNMVTGRIIQSGGNTKISFVINIIGTWIVGIPLGLLASKVLKLDIWYIYAFICFEEVLRVILSLWFIYKKKWINFIEIPS